VIASAAAGVSELIEPDRSGYVLEDPESAGELGHRMRALADPAVRRRMAQEARRTAENYCWDRHFDRILGVYEEVREGRCRG
jgi:glycosyltransferase involved in cell wall biosynthesis